MSTLSIASVFIRECFGEHEFPREPEPALIMDDVDQVNAYEKAGRKDGVMNASYLFQAARISQVIKGCKNVVDLGCGPATQLSLVAECNPDISFLGVDFSQTMLESAKAYVEEKKLTNIQFLQSDITKLDSIDSQSFDGVISTMALHHLPTHDHLALCFKEAKRILKRTPAGALYLVDFGRLKSLKSVIYFAYMNRKHQPHLFSLDYERSLRAAFLLSEFTKLKEDYFPDYNIISTFLTPLLIVIKSADHKLSPEISSIIQQKRENLPPKYRRILDDMRFFFKLGGLKNDPF